MGFVLRHGEDLAVRAGGHSFGGHSSTRGVLVDVTPMRTVTVFDDLATVGAGASLGEVYGALREQGVTIPGGTCPSVGVSGLTLGGGLGILGRTYGVTSDSLVGAEIVQADGRVVTCDEHHEEDLFWALRGAGCGNFGVVTSLVFRPVPAPEATNLHLSWPFADAAAVIDAWQAWAPNAPDDLFSMCDLIATDGPGGPIVASNGQYFGSEAALQTLLQPLVSAATPQTMVIRTRSFVNAALDWANCSEYARCHLVGSVPNAEVGRSDFLAKSDYVATPLPSAGIQAMIQWIAQRQNDPALGGGSILMDAYGGAINRVAKTATAFVHRDQLFSVQYVAADSSPADLAWLRGFRAAMGPYVSGQAYQNYADPDLPHPNIAYYGSNYARLRMVKRRFDPKNVFRFPRSVVPAPPPA